MRSKVAGEKRVQEFEATVRPGSQRTLPQTEDRFRRSSAAAVRRPLYVAKGTQMRLLAFAAFMFLNSSLQCQPSPKSSGIQDSGFAFYLLRDSTIATFQILNVCVDSLALAREPLFTGHDIKTYSWSTHTFVLKSKVDSLFKAICIVRRRSRDVPFVVTVGDTRIYLWEFNSPFSSLSPQGPYIAIGSRSPYRLEYSLQSRQPDRRSDKRIRDALHAAGVLIE